MTEVPRDELQVAIEARKEVGEDMEPALIDAFVERIERRPEQREDQSEQALKRKRDHQKEMVLGAMAISIPLFAIASPRFSSVWPESSWSAERSR